MSLSLAMSGIAGATRDRVEAALAEYARSKNGHFRRAPVGPNTAGDALICDGEGDRLTIVYPGHFEKRDEASA
jgi:hypothetical protein